MIVATTGVVPVFTALNAAMLPVPLAPNPMLVLLFTQVNTVPGTLPVNDTEAVVELLHTTWLAGWSIVGVGFTVIVNVIEVPVHVTPFAVKEGVTVKVLVSGAVPVFVAVKAGTLPVPLVAARPMASPVRDQAKTVPDVLLENTVAGTVVPTQLILLATALTDGTGFTVTVADFDGRQVGSIALGLRIAYTK